LRTLKQLPHSSKYVEPVEEPSAFDSSAPHHDLQPGMSLKQILAILRSYWKQTLLIAILVAGASAAIVKSLPKTYTATATLIVTPDKNDPLAAQALSDNTFASYVATQMELVSSPIILQPVVDQMNLTSDKYFAAGYSGTDPNGLREYTERNLAQALEVELGRGGQLMYISASAREPTRAADIANTTADLYLAEEQRRLNGPAGDRARRYAGDLAELRAKVATAQDKLTAYRQQKGITDVSAGQENPNATDTDTQALRSLEEQLLIAQNARRTLEAKSAGQEASADEAMASPIVVQLKTQLATQQTLLSQLSATYGVNHPKVLEAKSQIALTTEQLKNELHNLSENVATQLARARDLEAKYAAAVTEQRAKVLRLRDTQGEGGKLLLELESAQSVYKRALDGYDQIMFASAGDNTNVSIVSRATPPVKYAKPNKVKMLVAGCMAGLGLGLAGPFIFELLVRRRLRCRDDLERGFGIPVLAQFGSLAKTSGAA
jgi:polysaccharide biosynthesis transport protein